MEMKRTCILGIDVASQKLGILGDTKVIYQHVLSPKKLKWREWGTLPIYFALELDDLFQGRGLAIGCCITTRAPLAQNALDGALTGSQPSLNLTSLASDKLVDALEFGVEDGEQIALEFAGAAVG